MRPHCFVAPFAVLLRLCHGNPVLQPIKIDFGQNDDNASLVQSTCGRIHSGETNILAMGLLINHFVLLTSDLFLFELQSSQFDSQRKPPFRLLVDEQPRHLRTRFPCSYPTLERLAGRILFVFTMARQSPAWEGLPSNEYLVFSHLNDSDTVCLLAIDLRLDQAVPGPCDERLAFLQAISDQPSLNLNALFLKADERPQVVCPQCNSLTLIKDYDYDDGPETEACYQMDECRLIRFSSPQSRRDDLGYKSRRFCSNLTAAEGLIVAGFATERANRMYLVDERGHVHFTEDGRLKRNFARQPLAMFIGCYEEPLYSLRVVHIVAIGVAFLVVQPAICVGFYSIIRGLDETMDNSPRLQHKEVRRRSRKKRKSVKSSSTLSADPSFSSKSVSKRRGSRLGSRRSKSSVSRSRRSRSRGSRDPHSVTAPLSNDPSVSRRRDSSQSTG